MPQKWIETQMEETSFLRILAFWACTSWQSNLNFIEGHTWEIIYLTSAGTAKVNSSDCNTSNTEVGLNQNLNTQISYQALLQIQMSTLQKRLRFPVTQPNNRSATDSTEPSHWGTIQMHFPYNLVFRAQNKPRSKLQEFITNCTNYKAKQLRVIFTRENEF